MPLSSRRKIRESLPAISLATSKRVTYSSGSAIRIVGSLPFFSSDNSLRDRSSNFVICYLMTANRALNRFFRQLYARAAEKMEAPGPQIHIKARRHQVIPRPLIFSGGEQVGQSPRASSEIF